MTQRRVEPDTRTYLFGAFRFAPAKQLLLREGVPVHVGGRALDILAALLRHPGELVTKADLEDFVWPNTAIHESSLRVNIAALRRALGELGACVTSVPTRGYRFTAPVQVVAEAHPAAVREKPTFRRTLPEESHVIGRSAEISDLVERVRTERCLSIVGPGGVGKTTVAVAVAHKVKDDFRGGICFVDLATVGEPQYVGAAVANAVGARQSADDPLGAVINVLLGRRLLLVLDNCEHLTAIVHSAIRRLLSALPDITILTTSREPTGVDAEHVYRLPTLKVPLETPHITTRQAMAFPAVQLFVARAAERTDYVLTDADAPLVSAICQRLDGIALAIELAASKTAAFGVPKLLTLLEQRFPILSNGPREAPLRQQTLQATLDWSYRLLSDDEAILLRHLSLFSGIFFVTDAVGLTGATGLSASESINALERLVARSLVSMENTSGMMRCRLLESTRAYAAERLTAAAEQETGMRAYAAHILSVFERSATERLSRERQEWVSEYAPKLNDLRKVVAWGFSSDGDRRLGIRLTAAAIPLWEELSLVSEFRARVADALKAIEEVGDCPLDTRMRLAWSHASGLNFAHPLVPEIEDAWLDCYDLGLKAGNIEYQLRGLWGLAIFLIYAGRSEEAISRLGQFKQIAEANEDWTAVPEADRLIAMAEIYMGRLASARKRLEDLSARFRKDKVPVRNTRYNMDQLVAVNCSLAFVLWICGEPGRAMQVVEEAHERANAIGGHIVSHSNLLALAAIPVALWSGDIGDAERYQALLEENGRQEDIEIWGRVDRFFRGALRAYRNEPGGLEEMKSWLEQLMDWRLIIRAPMYYCMVTEVALAADNPVEAHAALTKAQRYAASPSERWCRAEVLRAEALVCIDEGDVARARKLLTDAIRDARDIGALGLEVRAALVMAQCLEGQGRPDEAIALLDACRRRIKHESDFPELSSALERLRGPGSAQVA